MIKTGNTILDATLKQVAKALNKPDAFTQGPGFLKADAIPTGSTALDMATGIGGVPVGRVIELYGPESSGKTSLALSICANWLKMRSEIGQENRKALYVDLEHVTGADLVTGIGVPLEEIIWFRAETTEEALNTLETLVETEQIGLVILDSVDALQSEAELKKDIGQESMGGTGKHMSKHLRKMSKVAFRTNTTMLYINQIRASMAMMGNPVTTPGGNALKFYASLRLSTMTRQDSTTPGAFKMRVKIIKNKNAPPRKDEVGFDFLYAKGPEPLADLVTAAKESGVIRFAGPSSYVKWDGRTEEKFASGGSEGIKALLIADPNLYLRLRLAVLATANPSPVLDTPEDTEPPEDSEHE